MDDTIQYTTIRTKEVWARIFRVKVYSASGFFNPISLVHVDDSMCIYVYVYSS